MRSTQVAARRGACPVRGTTCRTPLFALSNERNRLVAHPPNRALKERWEPASACASASRPKSELARPREHSEKKKKNSTCRSDADTTGARLHRDSRRFARSVMGKRRPHGTRSQGAEIANAARRRSIVAVFQAEQRDPPSHCGWRPRRQPHRFIQKSICPRHRNRRSWHPMQDTIALASPLDAQLPEPRPSASILTVQDRPDRFTVHRCFTPHVGSLRQASGTSRLQAAPESHP